mgnify:FL=1
MEEFLEVYGARVHNLKNIDLRIPRNQLVVFTGLSGSGKSSLAFDTIYAEGQRRYVESFSSYARQFLGTLERPDVDKINGLSPVISIEQKTVNRSPRSTVGTITEIYDFLRLLYARASDAYSYNTGEKMVQYPDKQILNLIKKDYAGQRVMLLSPLIRSRKGHYRELFQKVRKQGFVKVRVDGEIREVVERMQLNRYKIHDIELVVDRLKIEDSTDKRISESLKEAMKRGKDVMMVIPVEDDSEARYFSRKLMCPSTGISYDLPAPNLFSFNSPYGACSKCNGLGEVSEIDIEKMIPNRNKSIKQGGITPLGEYKNNWIFKQVEALGTKYDFKLNQAISEISDDALKVLLYGTEEAVTVKSDLLGINKTYQVNFPGVANIVLQQYEEKPSKSIQRWAMAFMNKVKCPVCEGARLKKESLYFQIGDKNISELANMEIGELSDWIVDIESKLNEKQQLIAHDVLKEIRKRVRFLLDVGLDYLSLNRSARSISGGEAQRIRLATQIGTQLTGVLYILDEPSIGLHQRDNQQLIESLKRLRDIGNSVIVVEHDKDMMMQSDYLVDIGPKAGIHGGNIVAAGSPSELVIDDSLTAHFLHGKLEIETPKKRRKGSGKKLSLRGASGHNLKSVDIDFPLGKLICVTGVSGSGKSTLIDDTLYPILNQFFYNSNKKPLVHKSIKGLEHLDKVIEIDQSPIGRTPRSNPATYCGVFSDIRNLFASLPESAIRGYKPGRFSFNVKGGRCEECKGAGLKTIEMNFLPDVYVTCPVCNSKRYNRETLEIKYKGKSINDVLNMTIEDAVHFFEKIPSINHKVRMLHEVGLGYVRLGQASTTLSGGEAQRVKLASELAKRDTGNTFYILDEPTTGLHFEDIRVLLDVIQRLVDHGNTVLIIEHNLDIIKVADHIIDLGPEGGDRGGSILFEGSPEDMIEQTDGHTAKYLKIEMKGEEA